MNKKIIATGLCAVLAGIVVPFAVAQAQTPAGDISGLEQRVAELKVRINEVMKLLETKNQNRPENSGLGNGGNIDASNAIPGTIESVDTANKSFKLKSGNNSGLIKVVYTAGTNITINGAAGDEGDLAAGLKAVVKGTKDSSGTIAALSVRLISETDTHDDDVEDANDDDSSNGDNNSGKKKQKKNFGYMNFGLEKLMNVFDKEVKTTESFDEPYILQLIGLTGEAAPVDSDTIKVDVDGDEYTVEAGKAKIVGDDDRSSSVSDIADGDIVTVVGTLDGDKVTATVIHIITAAE